MSAKITDKILSLPPYISTSWPRIAALHMKGGILVITMKDGDAINIPNLPSETIQLVFQQHANYLEKEQISTIDLAKPKDSRHDEESIRFAFGTSMDGLGGMMQHNPAQADAPDLPQEVLQKISAISKILAPSEEILFLPKAEDGCNCFFCQIARSVNPSPALLAHDDHVVHDEELKFEQWTIHQIGEKQYSVASRLDDHEKYNVYLGDPIGCTCGKQGCEHILAVLKS